MGSSPWPDICRKSKIKQYAMRLGLFATAARSDINSRLLTFARPPGSRFRNPRLDATATSAAADLIVDVIGLAVRSMIYRRVTADIMTNVEIVP